MAGSAFVVVGALTGGYKIITADNKALEAAKVAGAAGSIAGSWAVGAIFGAVEEPGKGNSALDEAIGKLALFGENTADEGTSGRSNSPALAVG